MENDTPVIKKKIRPRDQEHYVNNKEFYNAMVEYSKNFNKAKRAKQKPPKPSEYIGECIYKIAHRLATKHNFANYPFKEEMIGDGIENGMQALSNNTFNPRKSKNPFAYFTFVIHRAYLRRIQKEKKYLYTKYVMADNAMLSEFYDRDNDNLSNPGKYCSDTSDSQMREFMTNFEEAKEKKKRKTKEKKSLMAFIQE